MDAPFITVFDLSQAGYKSWWFPACGLIFIALGSFLVFLPGLAQKLLPHGIQGGARRIFSWIYFGFGIFWTFFSFIATYSDYRAARYALEHHEFQTVEGEVTDFIPMPATGHGKESFKVDGVSFAYSNAQITSGFNHTSTSGGPIRKGLHVRIEHINGKILKLEIRT